MSKPTFIGRINPRVFFLINGLLFATMSILAWFSSTVIYYWLPVLPIVGDALALSSFIVYNIAIVSLFITIYILHPEPMELKRYKMPIISVGIFFAILLALNNVVMFVDFSESVVLVYLIGLLAFSAVQVLIFLWIIWILKSRATGYLNGVLLLYGSFHLLNSMVFYVLYPISQNPSVQLTDPNRAIRYYFASMDLLMVQGYIEFGSYAIIALLFFIDTIRKPMMSEISVERVTKKGKTYIEKKKSTIETTSSGYMEYIDKAHTSEEKDIVYCKKLWSNKHRCR